MKNKFKAIFIILWVAVLVLFIGSMED